MKLDLGGARPWPPDTKSHRRVDRRTKNMDLAAEFNNLQMAGRGLAHCQSIDSPARTHVSNPRSFASLS